MGDQITWEHNDLAREFEFGYLEASKALPFTKLYFKLNWYLFTDHGPPADNRMIRITLGRKRTYTPNKEYPLLQLKFPNPKYR